MYVQILTFNTGRTIINLSTRLSSCTKRGNKCAFSTIHRRHILL